MDQLYMKLKIKAFVYFMIDKYSSVQMTYCIMLINPCHISSYNIN